MILHSLCIQNSAWGPCIDPRAGRSGPCRPENLPARLQGQQGLCCHCQTVTARSRLYRQCPSSLEATLDAVLEILSSTHPGWLSDPFQFSREDLQYATCTACLLYAQRNPQL